MMYPTVFLELVRRMEGRMTDRELIEENYYNCERMGHDRWSDDEVAKCNECNRFWELDIAGLPISEDFLHKTIDLSSN